jgi:hypothetical protein
VTAHNFIEISSHSTTFNGSTESTQSNADKTLDNCSTAVDGVTIGCDFCLQFHPFSFFGRQMCAQLEIDRPRRSVWTVVERHEEEMS